MKFIAQPMVIGTMSEPVGPAWLSDVARSVESAGFDALAFEDHPAPPRTWIEGGGHQAFDPFAAITFCAAVTERIRLLPLLVVVPYRNPLLLAKSIATADVLSGGRLMLCAGVGYLKREFSALGVPFDERNDRFDEAIDVLGELWDKTSLDFAGAGFDAQDIVSLPRPAQLPRPPVWIGGNSALSRERVARFGDGWAPLQAPSGTSRMARTAGIDDDTALVAGIEDLRRRADAAGRDGAAIDVAVTNLIDAHALQRLHAERELERLGVLAEMGVTWTIVPVHVHEGVDVTSFVARYGEEVIARFGP